MASGDDTETLDQEARVKPKGNETFTTGTLVVSVPKNAPELAPTELRLAPTGLVPGANSPRGRLDEEITLPIGTYDLFVGRPAPFSIGKPYGTKPYGTVVIKGGEQVTMTLPVLAPVTVTGQPRPADLQTVYVDYGPAIVPMNASPRDLTPSLVAEDVLYWDPLAGPKVGIVLAPGETYRVERPKPDDGTEVLATLTVPKSSKSIHKLPSLSNAWDVPTMNVPSATLEVISSGSDFPARDVLVRWACEPICDDNLAAPRPNVGFTCGLMGSRGAAVVINAGVAPKTASGGTFLAHPKCHYEITGLASGDIPIDSSQPKTSIHVGYIDVEDVVISHTNGGKRTVKGQFSLSRAPGPGQKAVDLGGSWETGNAVPVAPGTYVVLVRYADNTGPKSYTETVTVK
ncbi:MAG TPA: hypothetical protein VM925_25065 [Labilithrix sp.]|nr:hypothetical protein [Labilithrix sp.]